MKRPAARRVTGIGLILALCSPLPAQAHVVPTPAAAVSPPKHVLMLVNEGFWAPEYYEPRATFDRAGFRVTVAGKHAGLLAPDPRNKGFAPVKADITFEQADLSTCDAITFAGGNGAWTDYFPSDAVHKLVATALQRDMVTGLLCASTGLLGVANNYDGKGAPLARGRHVTGYYRVEGILRTLGQVNFDAGEPGKPYVVVDGNLITGRDPQSARLFGEAVARRLLQADAPAARP